MKACTLNCLQYIPSTKLSWREVHGELVAIDTNNGEYHVFNPIGKLIWLSIDEGQSVNDILEKILKEYDVNKDSVVSDLNEFLVDLCERGLLISNPK